MGKFVTDQNPP